jgi:GNAT superfamily N-acetyltransferase
MGTPEHLEGAADRCLALRAGWVTARIPATTVSETDELILVDSGLPYAPANLVASVRLADEVAQGRCSSLVEYFRARNRPFEWHVTRRDRPVGLRHILADEGMTELEPRVDLARHRHPAATIGDGVDFSARRAVSFDDVLLFAQTLAARTDPPNRFLMRYYMLAAQALLLQDAPLALWTGYVDGQPAAVAEITDTEDVLAVSNLFVRPQWRRRGLGASLVAAAVSATGGEKPLLARADVEAVPFFEALGMKTICEVAVFTLNRDAP